jgi:hypothetical protein
MRGLDNRKDVLRWLSIVNDFCEFACYKMKNPVDIVQMISQETPSGFIKKVFSKENVAELTKGVSEYDLNASVYEGLRLVQMLCYKVGTEFEQVRLRGRDFWASFSDDKEPQLDVDPAIFAAGGAIKAPRQGRQRANPFVVEDGAINRLDPFRRRPVEENAPDAPEPVPVNDWVAAEQRIMARLRNGRIGPAQAGRELQAVRGAQAAELAAMRDRPVPVPAPEPVDPAGPDLGEPGALAEFAARMWDNNRAVRIGDEVDIAPRAGRVRVAEDVWNILPDLDDGDINF